MLEAYPVGMFFVLFFFPKPIMHTIEEVINELLAIFQDWVISNPNATNQEAEEYRWDLVNSREPESFYQLFGIARSTSSWIGLELENRSIVKNTSLRNNLIFTIRDCINDELCFWYEIQRQI